MKAIGYSFSIRHVRTYILRAIEIQLLGTFHPASFKTERLVCVETGGQTDRRTNGQTEGQTDMARSTRLETDGQRDMA